MPFVSRAQQKWGNSPAGQKALGGPSAVAEWNASTPKSYLPDKIRWPGALNKAKKKAAGSITHAG